MMFGADRLRPGPGATVAEGAVTGAVPAVGEAAAPVVEADPAGGPAAHPARSASSDSMVMASGRCLDPCVDMPEG